MKEVNYTENEMSIVSHLESGWIIDHEKYIADIYKQVYDGHSNSSFGFRKEVFDISSPFVTNSSNIKSSQDECVSGSKKRKRKTSNTLVNEEVEKINSVLNEAKSYFLIEFPSDEKQNLPALNFVQKFYEDTANIKTSDFWGVNNQASVQLHNNHQYIFPENSTFYCYDIAQITDKINNLGYNYDLILLDPPWWNKYIRRKKAKHKDGSYQMMFNDELKKIPLSSLLGPGSIVAVWCTNSPTNISELIESIFPTWGVQFIGKWYWLKVTKRCLPICPIRDYPKKQPFELLVFGTTLGTNRNYPLPENGKVIVSVPSAIHSHKPPLKEVLSPYLPPNPKCLELFARYLLPEWTSWGNEVLKLQHLSLYQQVMA